jgi:hypothetical protein
MPGPPAGQMQAVGPSFGRRLANSKADADADAEDEDEAEAQLEKRVAVSIVALYGISIPNPKYFLNTDTTCRCRFQVFMTESGFGEAGIAVIVSGHANGNDRHGGKHNAAIIIYKLDY